MYLAPEAVIINFSEEVFAIDFTPSIESKSAPEIIG